MSGPLENTNLRSAIKSVAHYVPEKIVTNDDLAALMDTSDSWIRERTGIRQRHSVSRGDTCTSLGVAAARIACERAAISLSEVDMIIAATTSPDYYFPGIGGLIQKALELPNLPALDIRAQCSGLVYGVAAADAFIRSGQAKKILLVCSEVQSPRLNMSTEGRDMAVIFGDGAGALVIGAETDGTGTVIDSLLGSDGSGADLLCLRNPENWEFKPLAPGVNPQGWYPQMDGRQVFKHAVARMSDVAEQILKRNSISPSEISWVFPHQANLRINEAVAERLEIASEKVLNNIERYGNTTAATIPILMSEAFQEGKLRPGDLILTLAFGAGFTWGANLIRW